MPPERNGAARWRRWRPVSNEHTLIVRGILWSALFVLMGKAVSAAKEVAVAWRYGVSEQVDAYLFVFNLVSWPVSIWFAALPSVLVPLALRTRFQNPKGLQQFRAELLGLTLLLGISLCLATWLGLRFVLSSSWSGLPNAMTGLASNILQELVFLGPIGLLVSLLSTWVLTGGRHANTLLESLPALTIFTALVFFASEGISPLVWGTLIGFVIHLIALFGILKADGQIERPRFGFHSAPWKIFWQGLSVMLVGQVLLSAAVLVDQFSAAQLPAGAVSTLSYANRVLALVTGLGVTAVHRGILPIFSKAQSQAPCKLQQLAAPWVKALFLAGLIAIVTGWGLGPWMVKLLFERGAFGSADTVEVTHVLRHGLLQLPFYFAGVVLSAVLSARGHYKGLALASAGCLLVKIAGNAILVPVAGLAGLQWSTAGMYAVLFFALQMLAQRSVPAPNAASRAAHEAGAQQTTPGPHETP